MFAFIYPYWDMQPVLYMLAVSWAVLLLAAMAISGVMGRLQAFAHSHEVHTFAGQHPHRP